MPLCGTGNAPPIFFGLAKENGPRPVQKKNALADQLDTVRVELAEIRGCPQSARQGFVRPYWSALLVGGILRVQAAFVALGAAFVGACRKGFITSPARSASLRAT